MSSIPDRHAAAAGPRAGEPFFLSLDDRAGLTAYLRQRGWLAEDELIESLAPAGDGNMNCTIRVVTSARRLVVKQGRPWVERYPDIPAPPGRTLAEAAFYQVVAAVPAVANRMPPLRGIDVEHCVLAMSDCVGFADVTGVYEGARLEPAVAEALLGYLAALHRVPVSDPTTLPFANDAMRTLNHAYIFALPLILDAATAARLEHLTPGLARPAALLATDAALVAAVGRLGDRYLVGPPRALVHGDFFPGSWLARGTEVMVIDPEFCFAGAPEFDYGVMAAHLVLADQGASLERRVAQAAAGEGLDVSLVAGFAGVEVLRRVIGVAQLPRLARSLAAKTALLARSRRLILGLESFD